MLIQCDTREHASEWKRIESQFIGLGVDYIRSKLYAGDYCDFDNPRLVIDRKKDLNELCGNVCQQHERFQKELVRAQKNGIKIIILCEHGPDIKTLGDVYFWENPRVDKWRKDLRLEFIQYRDLNETEFLEQLKQDGVSKRKLMPPINGRQLYKSLCTIHEKYGVDFEFCSKEDTGQRIVELLGS